MRLPFLTSRKKREEAFFNAGKDGTPQQFEYALQKSDKSDLIFLARGAAAALKAGQPDRLQTILSVATLDKKKNVLPQLLIDASMTLEAEEIKTALQKIPADQHQDILNDALVGAIQADSPRPFTILTGAGADINHEDGRTLLYCISEGQYCKDKNPVERQVETLLGLGADFSISLVKAKLQIAQNAYGARKSLDLLEAYREKFQSKMAAKSQEPLKPAKPRLKL